MVFTVACIITAQLLITPVDCYLDNIVIERMRPTLNETFFITEHTLTAVMIYGQSRPRGNYNENTHVGEVLCGKNFVRTML